MHPQAFGFHLFHSPKPDPELAMNLATAKSHPRAIGRKELIAYLSGRRTINSDLIKAKCFECTNGYADGRFDCQMHECPLYPHMPYREVTIIQDTALKRP